ncbi:MAG: rod-binding protein [bacterium]
MECNNLKPEALGGLDRMRGTSQEKIADEKVFESFEAVFIGQLVRSMREAFSKELGAGMGAGKEIYMDWFDQAFTEALMQGGGIGIREALQRWVQQSDVGAKNPSPPQVVEAGNP